MDLKPCPFCGHDAVIERHGDRRQSTIYRCTSCSCMLETGEEWDHGNDWNKRADDVPSIDLKGYVIVPPISPWDEKHRDAIQLDHAKQTFGTTPGETWSLQCRRGLDIIDPIEMSTRVQYWHDRGYRIRDATLTIHKGNSDEA